MLNYRKTANDINFMEFGGSRLVTKASPCSDHLVYSLNGGNGCIMVSTMSTTNGKHDGLPYDSIRLTRAIAKVLAHVQIRDTSAAKFSNTTGVVSMRCLFKFPPALWSRSILFSVQVASVRGWSMGTKVRQRCAIYLYRVWLCCRVIRFVLEKRPRGETEWFKRASRAYLACHSYTTP